MINYSEHHVLHTICLVVAICLAAYLAHVPVSKAEEFTIGFYGTGAGAQGDFGDVVDNAIPGIDVQGFFRIPDSPLSIGLEAGYLHYGNENRNAALSETIPDVKVRVSRTNQILRTGLVLRYEHPMGSVIPHVDGMIGIHHFWTSTNVEDRYTLIPSITSTTLRDTAFAGGIGGGIMWEAYRDEEEGFSISLDAAFRYTSGGEATYLTEGDITIDNQNNVHLNKHTTKSDLLDFRIGVVVGFM